MDIEKFEILEQKILKLITRLSELEMENNDLKQKCKQLLAKIDDKENMIQQLKVNNKTSIQMQNEIENYKNNENKVKSKVENLLIKLKEFDEF
ncbi:MAG: cell division protein ZapB [bacterium]